MSNIRAGWIDNFQFTYQKKIWISSHEFVWVMDEGMRTFMKICSVVMKLNHFFSSTFSQTAYTNNTTYNIRNSL